MTVWRAVCAIVEEDHPSEEQVDAASELYDGRLGTDKGPVCRVGASMQENCYYMDLLTEVVEKKEALLELKPKYDELVGKLAGLPSQVTLETVRDMGTQCKILLDSMRAVDDFDARLRIATSEHFRDILLDNIEKTVMGVKNVDLSKVDAQAALQCHEQLNKLVEQAQVIFVGRHVAARIAAMLDFARASHASQDNAMRSNVLSTALTGCLDIAIKHEDVACR
jgi:hypothetical protein